MGKIITRLVMVGGVMLKDKAVLKLTQICGGQRNSITRNLWNLM